jgi:hypothetical protein
MLSLPEKNALETINLNLLFTLIVKHINKGISDKSERTHFIHKSKHWKEGDPFVVVGVYIPGSGKDVEVIVYDGEKLTSPEKEKVILDRYQFLIEETNQEVKPL